MPRSQVYSNLQDPHVNEEPGKDFSSAAQDFRPQIFRFLLASSRDADLAAELTQECFLRAHRSWSRFRGDSKVATWLMRIAVNLQRDYWRDRRLEFWRSIRKDSADMDEICEWVASGEKSAEERLLAREQVALVWKAVNLLRERQRTIFLLHFVEELKISEIAYATGLREGTVKAHLSRALKLVRTQLRGSVGHR